MSGCHKEQTCSCRGWPPTGTSVTVHSWTPSELRVATAAGQHAGQALPCTGQQSQSIAGHPVLGAAWQPKQTGDQQSDQAQPCTGLMSSICVMNTCIAAGTCPGLELPVCRLGPVHLLSPNCWSAHVHLHQFACVTLRAVTCKLDNIFHWLLPSSLSLLQHLYQIRAASRATLVDQCKEQTCCCMCRGRPPTGTAVTVHSWAASVEGGHRC
jgi:hypothetical protein